MSAGSRLLAVVEAEGQREREAVLIQARQRAEALAEEARAEARRIGAAAVSAPTEPAQDARLGAATEALLKRYAERARELEETTLQVLGELTPEARTRLRGTVVREVLAGLPPGVYRLETAKETWDALAARSPVPGRSLRWSNLEGALTLRSDDGSLAVGCRLETLVRRYFQVEASRVARLLLGDEPG